MGIVLIEAHRVPRRSPKVVLLDFLKVVGSLSVSVLDVSSQEFPGGGLTITVLLAESHAAFHSWPEDEHFVAELATCGDPADLSKFYDGIVSSM